jgi:hypothetical protein
MRGWVWLLGGLLLWGCNANDGSKRSDFYVCQSDSDCLDPRIVDPASPPPACAAEGCVDGPRLCALGKQGCIYAAQPCTDSLDCSLGRVCHSTLAVCVGCEADTDCGSGLRCVQNVCVP